MTLPRQFKKENSENILIYHYVEELVKDFGEYTTEHYSDEDITHVELPFLLRIRCVDKSTQKDLVDLFHVSNGYASKILRKFEDKGLITRFEDPENRRRKIVKLTDEGIRKTDKILEHIRQWENSHMSEEELETLKRLLFKFLSE
ncbi:MAG: MarR family transcriptional regulator [Methanobrevibacter sp.]|nr:MarR family transcriptional regulator [Methanobrevibacter sp.]MBQ6345849.1 MarR family transcriptional regulator [Methanobrevibacter sp.]MBQ6350291.1 MarR family transcriptional regulator [Methanobrevibacter sp.]MBQ6630364.1 MarR family transcriptional regulator [Methanobrevibacter sp.]